MASPRRIISVLKTNISVLTRSLQVYHAITVRRSSRVPAVHIASSAVTTSPSSHFTLPPPKSQFLPCPPASCVLTPLDLLRADSGRLSHTRTRPARARSPLPQRLTVCPQPASRVARLSHLSPRSLLALRPLGPLPLVGCISQCVSQASSGWWEMP